MTGPQNQFYWRLWAMLKKARGLGNEDRHGQHAEQGLPASHSGWTNKHLDKWKAHCLAAAQPGNYRAQIAQVKMPETRKLVFIRHLLSALEKPEEYAEAIAQTMERVGEGRFPRKWPAERVAEKEAARAEKAARQPSLRTLETLGEEGLEKVMFALKRECRRVWGTKAPLVWAIDDLRRAHEFDEETAREAVFSALNFRGERLEVEKLVFEDLLIVLGTLRRLVPAAEGRLVPTQVAGEVEVPF